ncbi:hypothetical protein AAC387_Pa03g1177 [Persea americana]
MHNKDNIWVIVDRLTKVAHFLLMNIKTHRDELARMYMEKVVTIHDVTLSIVSDRDPRFLGKLWTELQEVLGITLSFSTAYHPQIDGQIERDNQTLEEMLRACILQFWKEWQRSLPLCEFPYNNSYHSSINMAPIEALYGRRCKTPICWEEIGVRSFHGSSIVNDTSEKVKQIHDQLKIARSRQKSYADLKMRDLQFKIGEHVFLKASPTQGTLRFGHKWKLSRRYIGPFEILERIGEVAYRLALPVALSGVHNVFHVSVLKKYIADPSHVLQYEPLELQPNVNYVERPSRIIDTKEQVLRTRTIDWVKVQWEHHSSREAT